jgi:hypothetical protein
MSEISQAEGLAPQSKIVSHVMMYFIIFSGFFSAIFMMLDIDFGLDKKLFEFICLELNVGFCFEFNKITSQLAIERANTYNSTINLNIMVCTIMIIVCLSTLLYNIFTKNKCT